MLKWKRGKGEGGVKKEANLRAAEEGEEMGMGRRGGGDLALMSN